MEFCPRFVNCAYTHVDKHTALFTRLRCKQWSCEFCAQKNQSIWAAFLIDRLPEVADTWWLVTLTAHSKLRTAELSLKNIRDNIDRLMKRVKRVFGEVQYVRVYEKHPTSEARHAHLVLSGLSPYVVPGCSVKLRPCFLAVEERSGTRGTWSVKTWFKKNAQECNLGYMVDISQAISHTGKVVSYVVKYLTKSQQDLSEKGLRHVQTSRKIGSPKSDTEYSWKVVSFVTARDFTSAQVVTDLQSGQAIPDDYWNEQDVYPPEMI